MLDRQHDTSYPFLAYEGLLALTVDNGNAAHEIMKESVPQLCEAFKSGSNAFKILVCMLIFDYQLLLD